MRTIEILGPAGAGKTTVLGLMRDGGVTIDDHLSIGWMDRVTVLRNLLVRLLPVYLRNPSRSRWFDREELRRLVYGIGWLRALPRLELADGTTTIFDHGPIFMLAMLDAFGPALVRTEQYAQLSEAVIARWSDVLDAVVWLDAPDSVLAERIAARARHHCVKGRPFAEQYVFFDRCRASFRRILSVAASYNSLPVLQFDTGGTTAESIAARLVTELALRPGRAGAELAMDCQSPPNHYRALNDSR